ncbi:hypothetical protein [Morganella sp. EGD-HP17]|uniref:hypothetical protein n=1 Tax=Morganella sp. EGD-HP17 TaxID=1435146 RepID=UPI00044688EC|nr:hypothetical protein [Morganella sp. EGD-HP17]ETO41453.1 hypothetical protein X965_07935 [Morganella sp. EGD-HP17]
MNKVTGAYTEQDLEAYNDICDQAYTVIRNTDTSVAENHSQRRLLELDALLTHIRCDAIPQIIQDSGVLLLVQYWLEQLQRPAHAERSDTNNKVANNG